jgi:hypothetical protein
MEDGLFDNARTVEELHALLPRSVSVTKRIDKGLILKALGGRWAKGLTWRIRSSDDNPFE